MSDNKFSVNYDSERDFKGIWIPREIWLHPELLPLEMFLWAEIHSLYSREKGGCFASNDYLGEKMRVSERYIREMVSKLKKLGLIEEVSFNGRVRIIRAILPKEDFEPPRQFRADRNSSSGQGGTRVPGRPEPQFTPPPIYMSNTSLYIQEENINPPIPPIEAAQKKPPNGYMPAEAGEMVSGKSSNKKKLVPIEERFDAEVIEIGQTMLDEMHSVKPDYIPPKSPDTLLNSIRLMLKQGRTADKILSVFRFALNDDFWADKLFRPDPAGYLKLKFDQLDAKMSRPPPKKERKFAPSSSDERALARLNEMDKNAIW